MKFNAGKLWGRNDLAGQISVSPLVWQMILDGKIASIKYVSPKWGDGELSGEDLKSVASNKTLIRHREVPNYNGGSSPGVVIRFNLIKEYFSVSAE